MTRRLRMRWVLAAVAVIAVAAAGVAANMAVLSASEPEPTIGSLSARGALPTTAGTVPATPSPPRTTGTVPTTTSDDRPGHDDGDDHIDDDDPAKRDANGDRIDSDLRPDDDDD
jgi:hypothetical protein